MLKCTNDGWMDADTMQCYMESNEVWTYVPVAEKFEVVCTVVRYAVRV